MNQTDLLLRYHHIPAPAPVQDDHGAGWEVAFHVNRLMARRGPGGVLPPIPPDPALRVYLGHDGPRLRWVTEPAGHGISRETFEAHALGLVCRGQSSPAPPPAAVYLTALQPCVPV